MKTSHNTTTPVFFMPTPLKKHKAPKPFKFNRRLNNRMATLSKSSPPVPTPVGTYQMVPVPSMWMNAQLPLLHPIAPSTHPSTLSGDTSTSTSPPSQNVPLYSSYKPFTTPRVSTTYIPLNVCPTEYSQITQANSAPLINILQNRQEQNMYEHKSQGSPITHLIGDWIIRESSKPFQRKGNERVAPTGQSTNQAKAVVDNESIISRPSSSGNVHQWSVDDVCAFFERVLGKRSYASLIQEHLIDGAALVLLEDEHLVSIFQMHLGPRLKLLDRIQRLKKGDVSAM